jgi:hypothetical protein
LFTRGDRNGLAGLSLLNKLIHGISKACVIRTLSDHHIDTSVLAINNVQTGKNNPDDQYSFEKGEFLDAWHKKNELNNTI